MAQVKLASQTPIILVRHQPARPTFVTLAVSPKVFAKMFVWHFRPAIIQGYIIIVTDIVVADIVIR